MDFEQDVEVDGALGLASYVLRPLLVWNHDRMMAGCLRGLSARLGVPAQATQNSLPSGSSMTTP